MRRVSSYGGPSTVPGSERLWQKLSSRPGLHLLSGSSPREAGFLAVAQDPQNERVLHRSYGAAENFDAIAYNLKQIAKRESWLAPKDSFGRVVKETTVFDDPGDAAENFNGGAPASLVEKVVGKHSTGPRPNDHGTREGKLSREVSFDGSQVIEQVEPEISFGTSSSEDHVVGLSDPQGCESSSSGTRRVAGELPKKGPDLQKADESSSVFAGQDAETSGEEDEAAPSENEAILNNEMSREVETGADPLDCEDDRFKDIAAINIQRHWKGWLQRKHFNEVKARIVFLQSLVKRNKELKQYHGTMKAALVLQKYWRVVQSVKALRRLTSEQALGEQRSIENAAIVLQKYWQSVSSRRLLNKLRKERDVRAQHRTNNAAVVLQKHWRAHQGRVLVEVLKREQVSREQERFDDAAMLLQKHWRGWRERSFLEQMKMEQVVKQKQRVNEAAVVLQKHWRAQKARCLMKYLELEQVASEKKRFEDGAVVIQKHWRARQGRFLTTHLKMEQAADKQRANNSAIMLQKYWRARQARCLMKHLRFEQGAREKQETDDAAGVIQKHWRAWRGRCFVKQLRLEQVLTEQQSIQDATIVLQKCWRAQQGRRLAELLKLEVAARERLRRNNAAIVLQKHWRAKQGRSFLIQLKLQQFASEHVRMDNAAIVLQKYWKARQGRSFLKYLRVEKVKREHQRASDAAIVVQKHWRAKQGRSYVKYLLVERVRTEQADRENQSIDLAAQLQKISHAAVVLQKLWRARQGRSLAEHVRMEQLVRERLVDDAILVLQKYWRGQQSRYLVFNVRKKQREENAALVVQKCWRGMQSRLVVKDLKVELAARDRCRATAATRLQKHWRARQSFLLVKHLKIQAALRDQQRLDAAATIFQKHWRGRHSRLELKNLMSERALKERESVEIAAVVLQKYGRRFLCKRLVKSLYLERAARELAAVCIQARVRGNATRVKLKAALTIQKAWQLYWCSRLTVSAVSIQQAFPSSTDDNWKIQAVIILQAYARGFVARRRLGKLPDSASLSPQLLHTSSKTFTETDVAPDCSPRMVSSGSNFYSRGLTTAEDFSEPSPSSSIVHHVGAGESVNQTYSSFSNSPKHDSYPCRGLDGEFSSTSVGDVQFLQKNGLQEDWNYVAVDQLEECLDTCLAALKPISSGSQQSLPELDVPEMSQQFISIDQPLKNHKNVDRLPTGILEAAQQGPGVRLDICETDDEPSNTIGSASEQPRIQSDLPMSLAPPIGRIDRSATCSCRLRETSSQQTENPAQGRNLGRYTMKQNEQRLKQFAQVFLLQRQIALQQQRAQAAPPFPPVTSLEAKISRQILNQPLENENRDQGGVAVDDTREDIAAVRHEDAGRPKDDHFVCEITDLNDEQTGWGNSSANQNAGSKQVSGRPGPDVVLDMVLLLRRIEAEYGTSGAVFEGESSTWCTPGCRDIEEGIPLLDRDFGSMRRESSFSNFANAVSMKHISIPDVNAVLLVFIAMVVYTRTVCKGLFFGARQTHRRP